MSKFDKAQAKAVLPAIAWLAVLLCALLFLFANLRADRISSDITGLMPFAEKLSSAEKATIDKFSSVFIVALATDATTNAEVEKKISAIAGIKSSDKRQIKQWEASLREMVLNPLPFLAASDLDFLDDAEAVRERILSALYSPVGAPSRQEIQSDPLLLGREVAQKAQPKAALKLEQGQLTATDSVGKTWRLLFFELAPTLESSARGSIAHEVEKILAPWPNGDKAVYGVLFYEQRAAQSAKNDFIKLGSISGTLLLLLFFITFRSLRPPLLAALSIASGMVMGATACLLLFEMIHGITLVLSMSIAGLAADYTIYFCYSAMYRGRSETASEVLAHLRVSLLHAAATTVIAYALLALSPFAGLRELAVFAGVGIASALLTVLFWYGALGRSIPVRTNLPEPIRFIPSGKFKIAIVAAVVAFTCLGLSRAVFSDDPEEFFKRPEDLQRQEKLISDLLKIDFSQNWCDVSAGTSEALLEKLNEISGRLKTPLTVPKLQPQAVQAASMGRIDQAIEHARAVLQEQGIQIKPKALQILSLEQFLKSDASLQSRDYFFKTATAWHYFFPVGGAKAQVQQDIEGIPDVRFFSRKLETEAALKAWRMNILGFVAGLVLLVAFSAGLRHGVRFGFRCMAVIAIASLSGLASLGWLGWPITVFSAFALVVTVGLGIDYCLFYAHMKKRQALALRCLSTAAASTLISLGILVMSFTPAVRNFGLVLSVSVLVSFLLAPLCAGSRQ